MIALSKKIALLSFIFSSFVTISIANDYMEDDLSVDQMPTSSKENEADIILPSEDSEMEIESEVEDF